MISEFVFVPRDPHRAIRRRWDRRLKLSRGVGKKSGSVEGGDGAGIRGVGGVWGLEGL